ncbi:hypothetical protein HDU76_010031, partial [Blyttiomyces sp. JEL0837]
MTVIWLLLSPLLSIASVSISTVSGLGFGGAGQAIFFREKLDFPDEISYRALMTENFFVEDMSLMPHMIAQCDGGSTSLFDSLEDVTIEAWVKPIPKAEQFSSKGCCWP